MYWLGILAQDNLDVTWYFLTIFFFFIWDHTGPISFKEMCLYSFKFFIFLSPSVSFFFFSFFSGFWKRKKILFLSLVPVKSFQKTFQRKFLGSVTSSRSEVVRNSQNPPSHLPEWEKFLTTLAPCSSGRLAYEACCRSKTHQKSTSPELGHDRGVGGSSISLPCPEQAVKASCNVRQ